MVECTMTTTILVGVDDSETAKRAAASAAALANALDAELHVVTAFGKFESERVDLGSDSFISTNHDEALQVAEQAVAGLRAVYPGLTFHVHAADGKPAEAIVRKAEELDVDLIVVGNKRVQGLGRMLGSIASHVTKSAHCDVYVAHTNS